MSKTNTLNWSVFTPYLFLFSPNVGNLRPDKTPYLGTFQAVASFLRASILFIMISFVRKTFIRKTNTTAGNSKCVNKRVACSLYEIKYSRMEKVKFVENSL